MTIFAVTVAHFLLLSEKGESGLICIGLVVLAVVVVLLLSTLKVSFFYCGLLLVMIGLFLSNYYTQLKKQKTVADVDVTTKVPNKFIMSFTGSTYAFCIGIGGIIAILQTPALIAFFSQDLPQIIDKFKQG